MSDEEPEYVPFTDIDRKALCGRTMLGEVKRVEHRGRFCCYHVCFGRRIKIFYNLKQLEAWLNGK